MFLSTTTSSNVASLLSPRSELSSFITLAASSSSVFLSDTVPSCSSSSLSCSFRDLNGGHTTHSYVSWVLINGSIISLLASSPRLAGTLSNVKVSHFPNYELCFQDQEIYTILQIRLCAESQHRSGWSRSSCSMLRCTCETSKWAFLQNCAKTLCTQAQLTNEFFIYRQFRLKKK